MNASVLSSAISGAAGSLSGGGGSGDGFNLIGGVLQLIGGAERLQGVEGVLVAVRVEVEHVLQHLVLFQQGAHVERGRNARVVGGRMLIVETEKTFVGAVVGRILRIDATKVVVIVIAHVGRGNELDLFREGRKRSRRRWG